MFACDELLMSYVAQTSDNGRAWRITMPTDWVDSCQARRWCHRLREFSPYRTSKHLEEFT